MNNICAADIWRTMHILWENIVDKQRRAWTFSMPFVCSKALHLESKMYREWHSIGRRQLKCRCKNNTYASLESGAAAKPHAVIIARDHMLPAKMRWVSLISFLNVNYEKHYTVTVKLKTNKIKKVKRTAMAKARKKHTAQRDIVCGEHCAWCDNDIVSVHRLFLLIGGFFDYSQFTKSIIMRPIVSTAQAVRFGNKCESRNHFSLLVLISWPGCISGRAWFSALRSFTIWHGSMSRCQAGGNVHIVDSRMPWYSSQM